MTKQRFDYTAYDDGTESIYDRKEDEYYFDMQLSQIEELMNELADENEQLKQFKSKVFNLLQDEIREESELLDYYLKEKAPYNADRQQIIIGVLKRLQKELRE